MCGPQHRPPWILGRAGKSLNELEREEIELTGDQDRFSVTVGFEQRFSGFAPVPTRPARPANRILVPGTVAYWRFDAPAHRIADLSGHGNELTKVTVPGTLPRLPHLGPRAPPRPAGPRQPVLRRGHEPAARHLSADSRQRAAERRHLPFGPSSAAGKTGGDPDEPLATLSLSGDRELQRAVYPLNQNGPVTNRGHELPLGAWWHVAVVNDGRRTAMYVKGCPVVRPPPHGHRPHHPRPALTAGRLRVRREDRPDRARLDRRRPGRRPRAARQPLHERATGRRSTGVSGTMMASAVRRGPDQGAGTASMSYASR
jgi:hypothetical protein